MSISKLINYSGFCGTLLSSDIPEIGAGNMLLDLDIRALLICRISRICHILIIFSEVKKDSKTATQLNSCPKVRPNIFTFNQTSLGLIFLLIETNLSQLEKTSSFNLQKSNQQ